LTLHNLRVTRDDQRALVYGAEQQVLNHVERAGGAVVDFFGTQLSLPAERRFCDVAEVQKYVAEVTKVLRHEEEFSRLTTPTIRHRKGSGCAHYESERSVIAMPSDSPWAMRELIVLHEFAHHVTFSLTPDASAHGDEFVKNYLSLVERFLGPELRLLMFAAMSSQGVKVAVT
jgi:putative metallohydrolase (TIGR04338 family)